MSWRDDLPSIPGERIRDAVMEEGARRVRRQRILLGSGLSVAIVILAGLAAVSVRHDDGKRTSIAVGSTPTTSRQEPRGGGPPIPEDAQGSSGLSGTVTVAGRPGAGVTVRAVIDPCCVTRYAYAGADGRYAITGLPAGRYAVEFSRGARLSWYNDKPSFGDADVLTLAEGQQRTGIDGSLIAGARISGRVTSDSGAPIAGIWVYFTNGPNYGHVETAADGTYLIGDLPPGDYTLQFDPGPPRLPYIGEYYNDKPETATADRVHVVDGEQRTGVDAALASAGA